MRSIGLKLLAVLALSMLGAPSAAQAVELTKQQQAETRRFAANNSLFVLYHEVAHLLFDQLQLPVLGREEDAADNLATWTLLKHNSPDSHAALRDAARGWTLTGLANQSGGNPEDIAANHRLDQQRAHQIVCLMVGSDKRSFRPIANEYGLDRGRQDTCQGDYGLLNQSLETVLPSRTAVTDGTQVYVRYHHAGGRLTKAADALKSSRVLDQVADEVRLNYTLRNKVRFNAQRCDEANAFYDPDTVEIIFCYELMEEYMNLYGQTLNPQAARVRIVTKDKMTKAQTSQ